MIINEKIEGKSIYLAQITEWAVTEEYVSWLSDEETNRYMETRHNKWTINKIKEYVKVQMDSTDQLLLGIFVKPNLHIGNIKLGPINNVHKTAPISIFIGNKEFWGRGYAIEAILLLRHFAFENIGIKKLTAGMYADNIASLRAFMKADFSLEGILKRHCILFGDKRTDLFQVGCYQNNGR